MNTVFLLQELFPCEDSLYKPEEKLDVMETLLCQTDKAITAFIQQQFSDPLIGDQLCEIRAYQAIMLSKENLSETLYASKQECIKLLDQIKKTRKILESLEEEEILALKEKQKEFLPFKQRNESLHQQFKMEKEGLSSEAAKQALSEKFQGEFEKIKKEKDAINKQMDAVKQTFYAHKEQTLVKAKIEASLLSDILWIAKTHILSAVKLEKEEKLGDGKIVISDRTLVSNLKVENVKCKAAIFESIVPLIKKSIAASSIDYLSERGGDLQEKLQNLRFLKEKSRYEMPFYFALKALYKNVLREKIPIILKIRNQCTSPKEPEAFACKALFRPEGGKYGISKDMENEPAMIIEAYSTQEKSALKTSAYLQNFLAISGGLLNYLVEIDSVQHIQYSDQQKSSDDMFDEIPNLTEIEREQLINQRKIAIENGFDSENPFICCVEHVFADMIGNQMGGVS